MTSSLGCAAVETVRRPDRLALAAGAAAQLGGLLWLLQWAHVLVTHGPTGFNQAQVWLGMTWTDSAKVLALAYLLLLPGVVYLTRSARDAGDGAAAVVGGAAVAALITCAVSTPLEFLTAGWGSYTAYSGPLEPAIDLAGITRALTSSVVLALLLGVLTSRAARRAVLPQWMVPVLAVGCLSTYFIAGPLPPVAGMAWLVFGGWLLVDHGRSRG